MNKCDQIIWEKVENVWIVVSETSKSQGKGSSTVGAVCPTVTLATKNGYFGMV